METTLFADGSVHFAACIGSGDLATAGTKRLSGKVTFDLLATQCRSFVESTFAANFSGRIALVIAALGIALTAIATIQRYKNRFAVIVTGVVIAILVVAIMVAVVVAGMIIAIMVMIAVVLVARARGGDCVGRFSASATPADNADDGNCSEQVHPFLHSSILQHLIRYVLKPGTHSLHVCCQFGEGATTLCALILFQH